MLGPLVNPSSPQNLMLGTFNLEIARLYNYILQDEKSQYGIIHGLDGYDEISLTSGFKLFTKSGEQLINPEDNGLERISQSEIYGGNSVKDAAKIFKNIIQGKGTKAQNSVVLANAAYALKIIDKNLTFEEAYNTAEGSLLGGKASQCLHKLITNCSS
jgi:anthranilate phosphoribosyltransferase